VPIPVLEASLGFGPLAGGRRLRGFQLLAKEGRIAQDFPVDCKLVDAVDGTVVGLMENISQEAMHPADEFEAFRTLHAQGRSAQSIATQYGVTVLHVLRRLKLAGLAPELMKLYRKGEIQLDQVMALVAVEDPKRQVMLYKSLPHYARTASHIRRTIAQDEVSEDDQRVKLVAVTHVPTNGGLVNPAAAIGALTRPAGIPYLLDACQSVGQFPVDVEAIGCDLLSTTGRKYLRGPRGTGFVYAKATTMSGLVPPFLDVHAATWDATNHYVMRSDAQRFENWETNYAGKIGLATAIDYALGWGLDAIGARVMHLAQLLRTQLAEIPGVTLCDLGIAPCGIVTFTHARWSPEQIKAYFASQRINVTTSSQFGTRYDMEVRNLAMVVRASVHYYNDEDEIMRVVAALADLAEG
jgi:ParB-like chromosome segregation protein Spo0J